LGLLCFGEVHMGDKTINRLRLSGMVLLSVGLLAFLGGCAGLGRTKAPDLDARVKAYAAALDANDLEILYAMSDPEYRKSTRLQDFIQRRNIRYADTTVQNIVRAEDGKSAQVEMVSVMKAMSFEFKNFKQNQEWILVDGDWYVAMKNTSFKGMMEKKKE